MKPVWHERLWILRRLSRAIVLAATSLACSAEIHPGPDSQNLSGSITYSQHVAPILSRHCASCHRPGGPGPFSLFSYDDVRTRAAQIVAVTEKRLMPPWLGNVLKTLGATDEALAHFRQAVTLDPDYADARNNLGVELGARGLIEEATEQIRQALAIDPDHADAHSNLGVALWSAGRLDAAAAEFSAALGLDPGHAGARENLALLRQEIAARGAAR